MVLLALPFMASAQQVSGTVSDKNGPITGATVSTPNGNGTVTDINGRYELKVPAGNHMVKISFIGYVTRKESVSVASGENRSLNITLEENTELLQELVVVGTRSRPRSSMDTAVPIDVLDAKDLIRTGQNSFDKALTYRVPSFNSVQAPVQDANSLLDPYEIRNMGPSRTLILVNGKRKNLSALLYVQVSPGKGETGADISAIPQDAVKRVEILRDGASAQYGSDAIAGVMNIILKDDVDYSSVTMRTGITGKGDGESLGMSLNSGASVGENGFINYTVDFSKIALANRPGTVDAAGEAGAFGADINMVKEFLSRRPDAGNINGSPETTAAKFLVNGGFKIDGNTEGYFNAAYIYKNVNSYANYRTPYWRPVSSIPYLADFFPGSHPTNPGGYDGYGPTFDGLLNDYNATVGFKSEKNGWTYDGSFTTGGNGQSYKVKNSHNKDDIASNPIWTDANGDHVIDDDEITLTPKYRLNSPISFDPGGTAFAHHVGNIDVSKSVSYNFGVAFGAEFRSETFTVIEGELASYDGGGADSFAGNRPENSGQWNRYNFGGYLDLSWDVTKNFLLNGTARLENYSDFGQAFVWKLSTRYKLMDDMMTFRASASTGFRAPTLHQIYTQKSQYTFIDGAVQIGGVINNVSPQAKFLGIDPLYAEKSTNVTVGLGIRPAENFSMTVDYYNIAVKDRIVLSTDIKPTEAKDTALDQILEEYNLKAVNFFMNAIDTKTSGIDFVSNLKTPGLGNGTLEFILSGNYTIQNGRDGTVKNPALLKNTGQSVVDATQEALFFTSRPKTKWILGANYDLGKFGFSLNNTYFGKSTFRQGGLDSNLKTEFIPKIVTDLGINYAASDKVNISFNVNNLLNVLPEWKFVALNSDGERILNNPEKIKEQSNEITFNQRYSQVTYDGSHFSQLGSLYNLTLNVRF